jgi:hypothetical protein
MARRRLMSTCRASGGRGPRAPDRGGVMLSYGPPLAERAARNCVCAVAHTKSAGILRLRSGGLLSGAHRRKLEPRPERTPMRVVEGRLRSIRLRKRPSTAGGWYGRGQAHLGRRPPLRMLPQIDEGPGFSAVGPLRASRPRSCGPAAQNMFLANADLPRVCHAELRTAFSGKGGQKRRLKQFREVSARIRNGTIARNLVRQREDLRVFKTLRSYFPRKLRAGRCRIQCDFSDGSF